MLTGVKKTFGEDLLLFLVFNTRELRKIAEHFVTHDHHSATTMPVIQQLTASPIIFHTAQLVHLQHRTPRAFVYSHTSTHTKITHNNDRSHNTFYKAVFTFLFLLCFKVIMTARLIDKISAMVATKCLINYFQKVLQNQF